MIEKKKLEYWYRESKKSVREIAQILNCSEGRINYWLEKHSIPKRSISEALYTKHNPNGDPFTSRIPRTHRHFFLFGLGLGLYWGEGNKKNLTAVRLGNTDPHLIRSFLIFLRELYDIDDSRLRFGLQLFSDMDQAREERFWQTFLNVPPNKFGKTVNTRSGSIGTYREKSKHGVLTIYFHSKKLRDTLIEQIERTKKFG